jgi:hypothetical protein
LQIPDFELLFPDPLFNGTMIMLNDIVQVLDGPR